MTNNTQRDRLKILVDPDDADVDIVFVHGIPANDTWTHQNGTFWPQLLLPQLLPSARIILFEYNAYFLGYIGTRTFQDLQRSLLKKTVKIRREQKEVHRPVVFIAHSLGGIVVKMTLKEAEYDPQYSCLNASIYGIVCFATPREGSNTDIVEVAERICSFMTEELPQSLDTFLNTTFLREISRGFAKLSDHQHNLEILAFYEQRRFEYLVQYDVDAASASSEAAHETSLGLDRNHFDICKFSGVEDPEYQLVATYLERMVTGAQHHHVDCTDHPSRDDDVFSAAGINRAVSIGATGHQDSESSQFIDTSELDPFDGSARRPSEYWSTKLETILDTGNLAFTRNLLHEHFELVASDKFAWLHELRDLGYSSDEIAEVLLNERNDSPWIYFKPRSQPPRSVVTNLHQPCCVHQSVPSTQDATVTKESNLSSTELVENRYSSASEDDTMYVMEELCGLAGVSPSGRDPRQWNGQAAFGEDADNMTVSIHFLSKDMLASSGTNKAQLTLNENPHTLFAGLNQKILKAFQGFYSAVAEAQRRGICCNSFTILTNLGTSERAVELRRIEMEPCVTVFLYLKKAIHRLQSPDIVMVKWVTARAMKLCRPFLDSQKFEDPPVRRGTNHENIVSMLHYSSLAVQLLSLGFLSYNRAHVGAFRPFFLDTAIETVHLHGICEPSNSPPQISATLLRLTCLEDMIQNPVVVFGNFSALRNSASERYDLLTTPEDFIDTWGPGQYVFAETSNAKRTLSAMMIGGGSVKPVAEDTKMLHWSKDLNPRHESPITFSVNSQVRIGLGVNQNLACKMSLSDRLPIFRELLENLGTNDDYWAFTELQAGLAITGQQFVGAQALLNKTWTWHEGNTWKTRYFNNLSFEMNYQELEKPWGLQVSLCTGVARRVPLRLLLADIMPTFAYGLAIESIWTELSAQGIIAAFKGTHLQQWLNDLENHPRDLRIMVNRLVRYILYKLRDTGIDHTRKVFVVASPEDDKPLSPISMCLKVPCEKTTLWAKILEDSGNCATFACMTSTCLETAEHRCRTREPWDCPSLETAVCRHRSNREQPMPQTSPWHLENQRAYWIGKPDSGLLARAGTVPGTHVPRLYISASKISDKTLARLGAMSHISEHHKRGHIREKQVASWPADDVIVLSKASK